MRISTLAVASVGFILAGCGVDPLSVAEASSLVSDVTAASTADGEQVVTICGRGEDAYGPSLSWARIRLLRATIRTINNKRYLSVDGITSTYNGDPTGFYLSGDLESVSGSTAAFHLSLENGRFSDAGWPVDGVSIERGASGWGVRFEAVARVYDTQGRIDCTVDSLALAALARE